MTSHMALSGFYRATAHTLAARPFLAEAAARCDAMRASPAVTTETVVRHHPCVELLVRVWRAGELLGTIREDEAMRGWWIARDAEKVEERLGSRVCGIEWLIGRAAVRG